MEKIENIIERLITEFEARPIATTLKGLLVIWVLKQVSVWWKN